MKRTFFAVDIHPGDIITGILSDIRNRLKDEKIKWIPSDQMHLTLKFLGDTHEQSIPGIVDALLQHTGTIPVMNLQLSAVGVFRNLHNPRVIWIGIQPCPVLQQVVQIINKSLISFGFPVDEMAFLPHLTIGRIKDIKQKALLGRLIEEYESIFFGRVNVKEIIFYESILKPEGPVYKPLMRFPLQ
ncbi:MAG: RNA 2',3'-cyclic phosphodiesterase [Bacteroidales bacterium]|nr:RNA 2',3'-cyclic phosphodiesterase [Bacteroidales bacterium]